MKWVIVSDGSTDGTDDIVNRYAAQHDWIELLRMPERKERHFAGKAGAIHAGRSRIADLDYDIIGNLDADITVDEDYFRFLLSKFAENPRLGVAGTPFREGTRQYDYRFTSTSMFPARASCFEKHASKISADTGNQDGRNRHYRRHHGAHEGMGNAVVSRKGLLPSPRHGLRHHGDGRPYSKQECRITRMESIPSG